MSRKALFTDNQITSLLQTAQDAGRLIMEYYQKGHAVDHKDDASPVTEADRSADRLIVAALKALAPAIPIVSEEGEKSDVTGAEYFWLVDPLDGTRSFIRGTGYFTVNIGLIANGIPMLGIIYDPVHETMYWGNESNAFRRNKNESAIPIHIRERPKAGGTALISHRNINELTEQYILSQGIADRIPCASSIKFCILAQGDADIYPRFDPTMEWDTAAGHAILHAAGGRMITPEGAPFLYGKPGFLNGNFVALGC